MSSSSFAKHIHTFFSIDISQNTLVLCDIDDTILVVPKYSDTFYKEAYEYYTSIGYNSELADKLVKNDWDLYNCFKKRSITDKEGFFYLLDQIKKTGSTLCFVTARHSSYHKETLEALKYVNIDCSKIPIHYTNGYTKGKYIKENINLLDHEEIIFIDDNDLQLNSVKKEISFINCYKFVHIDNSVQ